MLLTLFFDQGAKHIREEGTLSESCPGTSLAEVRVVALKPFGEGWVNVIHKNTSNVDEVFPEVIEGANSIQEGSVIDLCSEADVSAILVNIALPKCD